MVREPFTFDRNEAAIDEALERRAFPELYPEAEPVPAATRLAWNLADELARIDAAETILARGYVAQSDYPLLSVLRGRSVAQARAETRERYRQAVRVAASARLAA